MLPANVRRIAIFATALLTLALVAGYVSVHATSTSRSVQAFPASTLWAWVSINGKCVQEYNGHQYYNECISGSDGRNDWQDVYQCPSGPNQLNGCWQGGDTTSYSPNAPYYDYTYVATQEWCGSWFTDLTGNQSAYNSYSTAAYTGWSDLTTYYGHDEQIYAEHTFVMHSGDQATSEHTCSKPPSYTTDCA
jgi:hypothetical protein